MDKTSLNMGTQEQKIKVVEIIIEKKNLKTEIKGDLGSSVG